ncbi:LysR family transcriptional regulator [Streptomyces cinnamoneus]|uniref:LysR family transcriptional regulator n=1 Tax=Streptomyces cinnamoneus TaxID=53446 RepID=A0A2G1XF36_STRCJ|nr:LysR family transcriptional regulator [Streptomyces cinnamoneus]PHQ49815.1 LysR family transcriptional regulator [Streptomyces cinnamoneus]PPT13409.1 LysR family transcriptional regulator [Streptomyces cinnamoneus]
MPNDIEPRLLRAFVAVADELHFTRAAARLYVAQQALSRDIRRLERGLGAELFVRTTRSVSLTGEGARLLPYVRHVLAAHDELAAACAGAERPLLVDVGARVSTGASVVAEVRRVAPDLELVCRYHSGLTGAAADLLSGRLDVSFGRVAGLAPELRAQLAWMPVRLEPMAVLLRDDHPLASRTAVPLNALRGETLYAAAGNAATAEWTDLAELLFEGRGITVAEPFPEIEGKDEFVRVVRKRGWSVLASVEFIDVPGMVLRPLTDPVPLSPVAMVWRRGLRHAGLDALRGAARKLAAAGGWLEPPEGGAWLPPGDTAAMGLAALSG